MNASRVDSNYVSCLDSHIPDWLARLAFIAATSSKDNNYDFFNPDDKNYFLQQAHQLLKLRETQGPSAMKSVLEATSATKSSMTSRPSAGRKGSCASSEDGVVNNYRARNAVSVIYDSAAQVHFETLVGEMNTARRVVRAAIENMETTIASGRMQEVLQQSQSIDEESIDDLYKKDKRDSLDREFMLARIRRRRRGSPTTTNSYSSHCTDHNRSLENGKTEKLQAMEECIKHVQDTCNTAAYQMLRDGQCSWEIEAISRQLKEIWKAIKEDEEVEEVAREYEIDDSDSWSSGHIQSSISEADYKTSLNDANQMESLHSKMSSPYNCYKLHNWRVQIVSDEDVDGEEDDSLDKHVRSSPTMRIVS